MLLRNFVLISCVLVLVTPVFANTAATAYAPPGQLKEGSQYHQLNEELKSTQPDILVIGDDTVQFWSKTHLAS